MNKRRTGFTVVAGVSGTAHSQHGAALNAAIAGCLSVGTEPTLQDILTSHVSASCVESGERLKIGWPSSPWLFNRGPPHGPRTLTQFMRQEITMSEAITQLEPMEAESVASR